MVVAWDEVSKITSSSGRTKEKVESLLKGLGFSLGSSSGGDDRLAYVVGLAR